MGEVILKNITKIYEDGTLAVKNANIEIKDKEFVVLVGPSGCGKSTTLRMIAGLEDITEGELSIDGKIVNDVPPKERDIAMVFQNYALYPHMSVYDNMAFGLKLRKFKKAEIEERVKYAASILDIEDYLDKKPKSLSGGQRQRVAVGRAIVRQPTVFLFDEPLSNLDAKLRVQMRTEISKLHRKLGVTMIYVTHDQTEAMTMGDRIVIMKDGDIQQIDTPLHLYNNPSNKFVAGFIGSPAMNFISGKVIKEDGFIFRNEDETFVISLPDKFKEMGDKYVDKEIILGVRPEDISIFNNSDDKFRNKIKVTLEVVEPMGNEIFIYFKVDDVQVTARIPAIEDVKETMELELKVNINKIHLYDSITEETII
ncbi:MAG: sn-glycerol-3-phosphate ABC transporter ATP-binding protein UgpC [Melioribacteraceae bacterium]|nr:sn-glycerol-3-phosphate ABC transporter ATP-binding protein UgpC [Melioribacteraceae bacterium]MCF8353536.1 sn-glycerol-3-phosphate ABC transporter ATP-binding protein UgpC [Melioribacteraceae bacterium]MCF8392530.1 sn-glycerol-3-phosphate ABC transporter ATP-binding protein UgpC [Melioribacteraceae bacterium]MCF8418455.1 sn-glycerol-3-phosphate ABC transporter ATP-binding protein UgpC [Melioribacteraceae bacterium]